MKKPSDQIRGILKEIRTITWPARQRVINDTIIVTISLIVGSTAIALVDKGLFSGFQYMIQQFQK